MCEHVISTEDEPKISQNQELRSNQSGDIFEIQAGLTISKEQLNRKISRQARYRRHHEVK